MAHTMGAVNHGHPCVLPPVRPSVRPTFCMPAENCERAQPSWRMGLGLNGAARSDFLLPHQRCGTINAPAAAAVKPWVGCKRATATALRCTAR
jgi:hypothetical protein